jgi:AcrR family transcriptional regulator
MSVDPRVDRTRALALSVGRDLLITRGIDAVTQTEVARNGGGARRTLYRHWPDATSLLKDVMTFGPVSAPTPTGNLRADLIAHLSSLRSALVDGHLSFIIGALTERAGVDPSFMPLRDELTNAGCEHLRRLLLDARRRRELPALLDVPASMAALEGPIFYRCHIRHQNLSIGAISALVDRTLAQPPLKE